MKRSSPNFLVFLTTCIIHPLFLLSIFLIFTAIFLDYFTDRFINKQNHNQAALINAVSTNHTILTNQVISINQFTNQIILPAQIIPGNNVFSTNPHLISILVGSTCTMQINAENFSIKDGILLCQSLGHNFYIAGSMHSIVIEEIKLGSPIVTSLLNKPPEQKGQNGKP